MSEGKHTKGPWEWMQWTRSGGIHLGTPDRGHLIVMDFVRSGMQGAQPRFAKWKGDERDKMGGIMIEAVGSDLNQSADALLLRSAPAMHLILAMIQRGVAGFESSGTLVEFCFDGIYYRI